MCFEFRLYYCCKRPCENDKAATTIPMTLVEDGYIHCLDTNTFYDEAFSTQLCYPWEYTCGNQQCIPSDQVRNLIIMYVILLVVV